jgi:predicted XRE-type DNA-binding protein
MKKINLEQEIWKDIKHFESYYQISNLARVKSLDRIDNRGCERKEKILKPVKDIEGYLYVNLYKNGKIKRFSIHRLVALTFIPNPNNYSQVNHKNDIKDKNYIKNLKWGTQKQNVHDAIKNGIFSMGEKHYIAKLSNKQIIEIRKMWSSGDFYQTEIAKKFNVHHTNISLIVNCKSWKHIPIT